MGLHGGLMESVWMFYECLNLRYFLHTYPAVDLQVSVHHRGASISLCANSAKLPGMKLISQRLSPFVILSTPCHVIL